MRVIDADVLRSRMYHEAFEKDTDMQRWDSGCWIRYKMFEQVLQDMPTADVRPNIKGKWVRNKANVWDVCNRCGDDGFPGWNYCPNCGSYNGG